MPNRPGILTSLIFAIFLSSLFFAPQASAENKIFSVLTPIDQFTAKDVDPNFNLKQIEIGYYDNNPDILNFWLYFETPIKTNMFLKQGTKTPWALLLLHRSNPIDRGGNTQDFRIENSGSIAYPTSSSTIKATATGNSSSGATRTDLSACNPETWSNISSNVNWIGFRISRKCANIPDKFWISAYADSDTNSSSGSQDVDWLPDNASFAVDLTSNTGKATPTPSATSITEQYQIISYESISEANLADGEVYLEASTTSGLPLNVLSNTPNVCGVPYNGSQVSGSILIELYSDGMCALTISQSGNTYWKPAISRTATFIVNPIPEEAKKPTPKATTKSATKSTPKKNPVISGSASTAKKTSGGTVQGNVTGKIGGSISTEAKATSITCLKGKTSKVITAVKPTCPSGYTRKQ